MVDGVHERGGLTGQVRAQVRGFHGTRSASGDDGESGKGQLGGQPGRADVIVRTTPNGVPAENADGSFRRAGLEQFFQRVGDRMVVQGHRQGRGQIVGGRQ